MGLTGSRGLPVVVGLCGTERGLGLCGTGLGWMRGEVEGELTSTGPAGLGLEDVDWDAWHVESCTTVLCNKKYVKCS